MPVAEVKRSSGRLVVGLQDQIMEMFGCGSDLSAKRLGQILDGSCLAALG